MVPINPQYHEHLRPMECNSGLCVYSDGPAALQRVHLWREDPPRGNQDAQDVLHVLFVPPPAACSTAPRRPCVTHSHSFTSSTYSAAIASLCPRGGAVGEGSPCYRTALRYWRGATYGSVICRPTLGNDLRPVRENYTHASCRSRVSKYARSPTILVREH